MEDITWLGPSLTWLGHASFFFTDNSGNKIYYVDPFDLKEKTLEKADLIFVTHAHPDHSSIHDINKIFKSGTIVIAPIDCLEQLQIDEYQSYPISPNQSYTVKGFSFITIPAYNTHPEKQSFHPKTNNWVGYIFTLNDKKIYHAGDTDFIEEMKTLRDMNLDVAILPIGGVYTMDVGEAATAANVISAKITIPMHYKRLLGENYKETENMFKEMVTNSHVVILQELQ